MELNIRSQIPGEAFVSAARHNPVSKEGGVFFFRESALMLPKPMRAYLWEDFIFNKQPSMEDTLEMLKKESQQMGSRGQGGRKRTEHYRTLSVGGTFKIIVTLTIKNNAYVLYFEIASRDRRDTQAV